MFVFDKLQFVVTLCQLTRRQTKVCRTIFLMSARWQSRFETSSRRRSFDNPHATLCPIADQRSAHSKYRSRTLRSEEHTSELQSRRDIVCRLLLEKKKK